MSSKVGRRDDVLPSLALTVRLRHSVHPPPVQGHSRDDKAVEGCQQVRWPGHGRPNLYGGQLRLRLVSKAGSLSATLLRYHLPPKEARRSRDDGFGGTKPPFQGARVG